MFTTKIEDFELIGFYEPDRERAARIEKEFGIVAYEDQAQLIADSDAV